jgi:hypothetical protein
MWNLWEEGGENKYIVTSFAYFVNKQKGYWSKTHARESPYQAQNKMGVKAGKERIFQRIY